MERKSERERLREVVETMFDGVPGKERLCRWFVESGYYDAPASKSHHGNYPGGLLDHSLQVTQELIVLTDKLGLTWQRPQSPAIIGMLHDICKADEYIASAQDTKSAEPAYEYNKSRLLIGHGDKSCILAAGLIELTEEELVCIRYHMGPYEAKEMWSSYGYALRHYPNLMWVHAADMIASQIKGI